MAFMNTPWTHGCPCSNRPSRAAFVGLFVHRTIHVVRPLVTDMLTFLVYLARRKRPFVWAPAVDLSDPYVAAALAPVTHS